MDAQPFSNTQGVYIVNSLPMSEGGQPESGACQTLSQHFQSNSIAGLEACSAEGKLAIMIEFVFQNLRSWFASGEYSS